MSGMAVFINLAGAVAPLLWATRMVRTGIERAYGNQLRDKLKRAIGNRVTAAIAGFFFAIALQSATAVALIVAGFVASGYVSTAIGIATLLGADLGSALVVRILRQDLSLLIPVLLLALLTVTGNDDLKRLNVVKNALATLATSIAVLIFAFGGAVAWGPAALVFLGAAAGGVIGGRLARRVKPQLLRAAIVCLGLLLVWHYA